MNWKRYLTMRLGILAGILSLTAVTFTTPLRADEESAADRVRRATQIFDSIMSSPDKGIPDYLINRAYAIAVIPHVVKGAFFVGGDWGKGIVSQRKPDGRWSNPAFITITGGSYGLQFGAEATDYVLVFTNHEGFDPLLHGKVKLGADASVAAGPVGRTASANTGDQFKSSIYTYSHAKGVFAGIALTGAAVTLDNSAIHEVYGPNVTAQDILVKQNVAENKTVAPFVNALDKYAPKSKMAKIP